MFDITKLSLGEIDKIEALSGQSISVVGNDESPKGKMLAALVFVAKRREQLAAGEKPSYTFNDAMGLPFDEAQTYLGFDDEDEDDASTSARALLDEDPDEAIEDPTESED